MGSSPFANERLILTCVSILTADSTLKKIPSNQLIKFGEVTATGNAVLRREIDEVEILSADWENDFSIPVCGKILVLKPPI